MKQLISTLLIICFCGSVIAQNNVGIGVVDPASRLHINNNGDAYTGLQITNNATGTAAFDGLTLQLSDAGNAYLLLGENRTMSLGTASNKNLNILSNGDIGFNTQSMLGSADFTLRSQNSAGFGGMFIESPDATGGRPFYGYALNGSLKAWHYYDAASSSWQIYVGGVKMVIQNTGSVGIGTSSPDASSILDISSTNRGFLPPRMSSVQRTAIVSPVEGLMVYDSTLAEPYVYGDSGWKKLGGGGLWSEDNTPLGAYFNSGNVAIGNPGAISGRRLYVQSGTSNNFTGQFSNNYTGSAITYGLYSTIGNNGTGTRYAVYGYAKSPLNDPSPAYGVYGRGDASGTSNVYGVYGLANGSGTGLRYGLYGRATGANNYGLYAVADDANGFAGYFKGEVRIGNTNGPIGKIHIDPVGFGAGGSIDMYDDDGTNTVRIHANQSATNGAEILMTNDAGFATVELDAEWDVQGGGYLGLKNDSSDLRVVLIANETTTTGGALKLTDVDGENTVTIRANQSSLEGAEILMSNKAGATTVEIDADWGTQGGGYLSLENDNSDKRIVMYSNEAVNQGAAMYLYDAAGTKTIELDADFGGKGRVITQELEITGGADLAEYFELSAESPEILAGQIVVIDVNSPGSVCLSKEAYDKKVVGIVSGANGVDPGMFMGQRGSIAFGDVPVAIAGRVYVKVDEAKYKIRPGDFLTTSDIPGAAMRIKNIRKARGSILGKALTETDESGYVLVLVNLQ